MAKHKYKAGQSGKQTYLNSIAQAGSRPMGQYTKYGDYNPSEVHEGSARYGRNTYTDSSSTVKSQYSVAVRRGEGKGVFRFQGKLYRITNSKGTAYEEVQV